MQDADRLALAVLQTPEVMAARRDMEARYRADPNAQWPLAAARIEAAVAEYALAAAQGVVSDPARPVFLWRNAYKREWPGLSVPAGRFGTDNPDNAYLWFAVSPRYSYRIEGKLAPVPARFSTWSLIDGDYTQTSLIKTVGLLSRDDLVVGDDGRFVITIDADPANGRPNHLQSLAEGEMLNLRETLSDWHTQLPAELTIRRTDSEPTPEAPTIGELAVRAARAVTEGAPNWALKFQHDSYEKLPYNQVQPIMSSAKRLGGLLTQFSSHGRFCLAEDEAYVVRVDPNGADYVGFQIADPWMVSVDYVDRLGCLNSNQAERDADGRMTIVISRADPGVANWLDAHDLDIGGTTIRFQGISDPDHDFTHTFETWHGKLADLGSFLGPGTQRITAEDRARQIEQRVADYRRREGVLLKT